MLLIVGLGNPGKEYEKNYHNLGFMALDFFAKENGLEIKKVKDNALIFEGKINDKKVILAKPQTFMNLSGTSVVRLMKRFQIEPEHTLIIYDDIDLLEAAVRYRQTGSGGTHNGMKNIIEQLSTTNVPRIRIGAGKDEVGGKCLADYVLSNIKNVNNYVSAFEKVKELLDEFIKSDGVIENKSVK
jgi:PTH1 family peptidyl-tRNA hydrolase